jgi:hypothetical protein
MDRVGNIEERVWSTVFRPQAFRMNLRQNKLNYIGTTRSAMRNWTPPVQLECYQRDLATSRVHVMPFRYRGPSGYEYGTGAHLDPYGLLDSSVKLLPGHIDSYVSSVSQDTKRPDIACL